MAARADLKTVISADMSGFSATMRRAGMTARSTAANIGRSMGAATRAVGRMAMSATKAAGAIGLMAAAGGAVLAAGLARGLKSAADLGGQLSDTAAQTGILAGNLAVLQRAFEDNGISGDKVGATINKMQRTISNFGNGLSTATRPFERLGITFEEISRLSPDRQFALLQSKIAALQSPTERAATAMEIFGKSGGQLLTLFADTGAFANAGKFLGTQAEILNRSAGLFDSISDKLARVPAKLQGFFVGFLDPIADTVDSLLTKFDEYDFAAIGQRLSAGLMNLDMGKIAEAFTVIQRLFVATLIDGLTKVVQFFSSLMIAVWSSDVVPKMGDMLLDALFAALNALGDAVNNAANWIFGFESQSVDAARTFGEVLQEELDKVDWSPSEAVQKSLEDMKEMMDKMFPSVSGQSPPQTSEADAYESEAREQRERVARDAAAGGIAQADGTTFGPDRSQMKAPEQFGPPRALMNRMRGFGEAARPSNRLFGQAGGALGGDNVFARDRAGMGIGSGLVTGGLGEKRRLNTSADDKSRKEEKKELKTQTDHLSDISTNIKSALTVS